MKFMLQLMILASFISCGKTQKTKSETQTFSLSSLQSKGITFYTNIPSTGGKIAIVCTDNQATTAQKLIELTNLANSLGVHDKNTTGFTVGDVRLTPTEADLLFKNAIQSLQIGNPDSTHCPRQVLATI